MNKHTPGPWRMRTHDLMQRIETCEGHTVAIPAMNDGVPAISCSANARLIAAAPELLDALNKLLSRAEGQLDTSATHDGLGNIDAMTAARAAIAKARGE